jgi:hypothetical protein
MDFLKWYKQRVSSAEEEPPEVIWEEIQNELDIEAAWLSIRKDLPSAGKKRIAVLLAAAATLLLLLGAGSFLYYILRSQTPGDGNSMKYFSTVLVDSHSIAEPEVHTRLNDFSDFPDIRQVLPTENNQQFSVAETGMRAAYELRPLPYKRLTALNESDKTGTSIYIPAPHSHNQVPVSRFDKSNGYYAGITGHLANTWLLNNKTMQGLKSDELTASLPSFGYNLGIVGGKNISNRFGLHAEIYFISVTRQNYNEYLYGSYINNNMQLSYSSFSITGRWHLTRHEKPERHALVFGAYTGILKRAVQQIDGESRSLTSDYKSSDYGILAGYEYLFHTERDISVGTGFQARYGLNNIFAGNETIPGFLGSTRNASFNLTLSVRYHRK